MNKFIYTCILFFNLFAPKLFSQQIELKLPLKEASYTSYSENVIFLWEDAFSSFWFIYLSVDSTFSSPLSLLSTEKKYNLDINTLSLQKYYR